MISALSACGVADQKARPLQSRYSICDAASGERYNGLMSSDVTIRAAIIDDSSPLAALITQLGYPTTTPQMSGRLAPLLVDPNYRALVAEISGRVVGMIGLRIDRGYEYDGMQARIVALVVDESVRGRGVGKSLMAAGESWAGERGAHKIMVNTSNHRTKTHEFYRAVGYEATGLRFVKILK
ncbi:GNAT family N-acetyltransferase [soil metagenome]